MGYKSLNISKGVLEKKFATVLFVFELSDFTNRKIFTVLFSDFIVPYSW